MTPAICASRYENLLLLDLPPPGELQEIEQWYTLQTQHRIQTHQQLEQRWSEEVSAVVAAEKIAPEFDEPFREGITALLSSQARSLVEKSVQECVAFFQRFGDTPEAYLTPKDVRREMAGQHL